MSFDLPPLYRLPAYFIGTGLIGLGINTFRSPDQYYGVFGLPLVTSGSSTAGGPDSVNKAHPAAGGTSSGISPFVYVKAARDIACGLSLIAFQATGNENGVNIWVSTMFIAGLVDGWVVWNWGGEEFRPKAWGHWIGTLMGVPWVAWRVRNL